MMATGGNDFDQISAISLDTGCCCNISAPTPANRQAAAASLNTGLAGPEIFTSVIDARPDVEPMVSAPGSSPPLAACSRQALLCILLI
jgi:hypothetical protein